MKKCIICANCQGDAIAKILNYSDQFRSEYSVEFISNFEYINEDKPFPVDIFSRADVFIYQPIQRESHCSKEFLAALREDCVKISFPYIYNSGAFAVYVENDKVIGREMFDEFIQAGATCDDIKRLVVTGVLDFRINERFNMSMDVLISREAECDIKASDSIISNLRIKKVFFSQNHFTNAIMVPIATQILDRIGLKLGDIEIPEQMNSFYWPVSPYEIEALSLPLTPDDGWKEHMYRCIDKVFAK